MELLKSNTDFVLEQFNLLYNAKISQDQYVTRTKKHADFLKQKLSLEQFIPCKFIEGVLVPIELPKCECQTEYDREGCSEKCYEYIKSKNRVLFEGFEVFKSVSALISFSYSGFRLDWSKEGNFIMGFSTIATIEDLVKYNLELTPTAQKQIGL